MGLINNADLTGSAPVLDSTGSIAGVTHEWHVKTRYYTASIPIWLDEISDIDQWANDFSRPEAREVVQAVGGWIYCVDRASLAQPDDDDSEAIASITKAITAIENVITKACGYGWEGVRLLVATQPASKKSTNVKISAEEWDDLCMEHGFEFVDASATGVNDFGEKVGLERLREALEANEWSGSQDEATTDDALGGLEDEEDEINAELWGLKAALHEVDDEPVEHETQPQKDEALQVDSLEKLMGQALAIKGIVFSYHYA